MFGPAQETSAVTATLLALPNRDVHAWVAELNDRPHHTGIVREYLRHRAEVHDVVTRASNRGKDEEAARYDRGIQQVVHHIKDLVMVFQKDTRKLEPRWRGPFTINGYGGSHGRSFTLMQINNRRIRGTFHGDHLNRFTPRSGYLTKHTPPLPPQQTIRRPKRSKQT